MIAQAHRSRFRQLHESGCFVMPNAWDGASAKILAASGFQAIATTSSGHAFTLGRADQQVSADELLAHAAAMVRFVDVPVSVDAERCFGETPAEVTDFVEAIAETGAAGCSIEDYDPTSCSIEPRAVATERVAAAADAARREGMVLTARTEQHLYLPHPDFDESLTRLSAFIEAGADCVYAPGVTDPEQIRAICSLTRPANILLSAATPTIDALASLGARRISTGSALARVALGALHRAATELAATGTAGFLDDAFPGDDLERLLR